MVNGEKRKLVRRNDLDMYAIFWDFENGTR